MDSGLQSVCIDLQPRDGKVQGYPDPSCPGRPPYTRQGFPAEPPPTDFVLWSLFNTIFCNVCCLGFTALVFSIKARDRKVLGDANGAESYGKTAKCLNITLSVLAAVVFIIVLVIVIKLAHTVHQHSVTYYRN